MGCRTKQRSRAISSDIQNVWNMAKVMWQLSKKSLYPSIKRDFPISGVYSVTPLNIL